MHPILTTKAGQTTAPPLEGAGKPLPDAGAIELSESIQGAGNFAVVYGAEAIAVPGTEIGLPIAPNTNAVADAVSDGSEDTTQVQWDDGDTLEMSKTAPPLSDTTANLPTDIDAIRTDSDIRLRTEAAPDHGRELVVGHDATNRSPQATLTETPMRQSADTAPTLVTNDAKNGLQDRSSADTRTVAVGDGAHDAAVEPLPKTRQQVHVLESVMAAAHAPKRLPTQTAGLHVEIPDDPSHTSPKVGPDLSPQPRADQPRPLPASLEPGVAQPEIDKRPTDRSVPTSTPSGARDEVMTNVQAKPMPMTPPTIAQSVLTASIGDQRAATLDPKVGVAGDAGEVIQWDLRGTGANLSTTATVSVPARTELPPQAAQQMALALQKAPDKLVEIALNPPELGRVRMVMNASETGVVVQVLTERTDTLDLMRRNIDELGRALSDLGYEDISFSFGQGSSDTEHETDDEGDTGPVRLDLEERATSGEHTAQRIQHALAMAPDGIDIRL